MSCRSGAPNENIVQNHLNIALLGPIYKVRFLSHARGLRQAYDMTYDCRSVLKHVLKCYDIFSDVHNNGRHRHIFIP